MGTIQRLLPLTAVLASLVLPTGAVAEDLSPTPAELQADNAIAVAYWHAELPTAVIMASGELAEDRAAQANWVTGQIELSPNRDWRDFPSMTCTVYVHEYGHLVLGPEAFPNNPGDPRHSPDPNNIMYGGGEPGNGPIATLQQDEAQAASVGCPPLQPAAHTARVTHKRHHHRHHHHR